jgi:hypothetical protein
VVAGLAIAAAGVGAGMAIQYYGETQPAQEQVTTLESHADTLVGLTALADDPNGPAAPGR